MQIKSPLIKILGFSFLLSSCSQNNIDEEGFELTFGEYPKLVSVPDRPKPPSYQELEVIENKLSATRQQTHDAAGISTQKP